MKPSIDTFVMQGNLDMALQVFAGLARHVTADGWRQ